MRLLLTGFEPFGSFVSNPSWDALQLAADEGLLPDNCRIARLPVSYARTAGAFEAAVAEHAPQAGLSFGLHGGMGDRATATIYIETTARNRDGANKADNDGEGRPAAPIIAGAPDTLPAGVPAPLLLAALARAGFAAELSDNAGAYLCNHLFYHGSHGFGRRFPYGFVHVPPVKGMVESAGGLLTLRQLAEAMAVMAHALHQELSGKAS